MTGTTFFRSLATLVAVMCFLVSCQKDITTTVSEQTPAMEVAVSDTTVSMATETLGSPEVSLRGFGAETGAVKFGKPNSTNYVFTIKDDVGLLSVSVKFFDRATGAITYIPMTYSNYGFGTWKLTTKLANNGWFDYRYVYTVSKNPISSSAYVLCNTSVSLNQVTNRIYWPFGSDGSSFNNRLKWIGARENGGCGSGWNIHGHIFQSCLADDAFAEDWNKNCAVSSDDDGATVKSPLDGVVTYAGWASGGYGYRVDIEQVSSTGVKYIFRIAHLKYLPSVSLGQAVKGGVTPIGNIGMTGGTSTAPHAHCVLYKVGSTNSCPTEYLGVKFTFETL